MNMFTGNVWNKLFTFILFLETFQVILHRMSEIKNDRLKTEATGRDTNSVAQKWNR